MGIYHVQGKGGLPVDIDTARTCFTKAAKLGHMQAQRALDLEKAYIKSKAINNTSAISKTLKSINVEIDETNDMHEKLVDTMTNFIAKSAHDAPGYNEEIARDSARVLIDILSLKESQVPVVTC